MNMQSLPTLISLILATSAFGAVSQSGDWTSTNTWSDSTVPGLSSDAPLPTLSFDSTGLELNVNENAWMQVIDVKTTETTTINIAEGKTLTALGISGDTAPKEFFIGDNNTSKVIFNGEGTLSLSSSGERRFVGGTWIFNTAVNQLGAIYLSSAKLIEVNGGWTSTQQISANVAYMNINSDLSTTSSLNFWGTTSILNIDEGVRVSVGGGYGMVSGTIKGNIVATSMNGSDQYSISFGRKDDTRGTILFDTTATMESKHTSGPAMVRNVNMTINSAAGSIKTASQMYWYGSEITLNSSDVFHVGGKASQGESVFNIATNDKGTLSSTSVSLILGADNDFGGFNFVDGSKLSITTNGYNVNIGGIYLSDGASNYEVEIYNLTDFTLKIGSLDNIATEVDEEGFLRTTEGFMVSSDDTYLDYAYLVEAGDGGYWVNVTSAVPEPAECAMILGALACALAFAKRRIGK